MPDIRTIALCIFVLGLITGCREVQDLAPPNILFVITDDQSWLHAGAYGDRVVQTPALDRLAAEGVVFENAFTAAPSCTPSRSSLLSGRHMWQVGTGGTLFGALEREYPVFPRLLQSAGYAVGHSGKTWGPGSLEAGGWEEHPVGTSFETHQTDDRPDGANPADYAADFAGFLDSLGTDRPFFFWMGPFEPHRRYELGSGLEAGKRLSDVNLPPVLPDLPQVRSDVLDYYVEIEHADVMLMSCLDLLEERGLKERTLVVFTSDNGMPFPRAKTTLYDLGVRMPLVISWPEAFDGGRRVTDFVGLIDLAPTFLEAARVAVPETVTGQSLLPQLLAAEEGRIDPTRDHVIAGVERHTWCRPEGASYPSRMLRTDEFLYIRNYAPDRWPAGDPDFESAHQGIFGDVDNGPTKTIMIERSSEPTVAPLFDLAFGKRPAEELYHLRDDPWQLQNLAGDPAYSTVVHEMAIRLDSILQQTGDPRAHGLDPWSDYTYFFGEYADRRPGADITRR